MEPVNVYSCPSGGTLSGSTYNTTVTQAGSVGGYTCPSGSLSGSSCITTSSHTATPNYSCAAGQTLSGTTCNGSTTNSTAGTPVYGCASGYTLSGTSCTTQTSNTAAATPGYSCPSGGTLSVNICKGALWRTRYEPNGNIAAGVIPTDLGFTGHVNDAVSGLVYMQQRYYDPIARRFLSTDPVNTDSDTSRSFGRYHYANNNPFRYIDPDGRDPWFNEKPEPDKQKQPENLNFCQSSTGTNCGWGPSVANLNSTASKRSNDEIGAISQAFAKNGKWDQAQDTSELSAAILGMIVPAGSGERILTVGRCMSSVEHELILSGRVIESVTGTTHVAFPANPLTFIKQAEVGSRFVIFGVSSSSLRMTGESWAKVIGPNSLEGRLLQMNGKPLLGMPTASDVTWIATKIR